MTDFIAHVNFLCENKASLLLRLMLCNNREQIYSLLKSILIIIVLYMQIGSDGQITFLTSINLPHYVELEIKIGCSPFKISPTNSLEGFF